MEAHKLRFVRCLKCYQLLVEYPSIPVYKCGGCGTVLRAKNRAVPAMEANSESNDQSNFPNGHKESPHDNKLICLDEQKIASSADTPHENMSDGIVSSLVSSTNSFKDKIEEDAVSVAKNVAPVEYQKEETCFLVDKNGQNPGITVNEMNEKGTGADFGSNLIEGSESLYRSENANTGNVEKVDMSEMSTLYKETETERVQREDMPHVYEGMHVESHEALIEELERSLSFSSDCDEYFSDGAETSGLSDALRHQMGSRRFMLGSKMNDTSRDDPHGRLIEELEMSFTDTEETMVHHTVVADKLHENKNDKHPTTVGPENAHPCEESIPSLDNTHLESEENIQQENRPIDNGNEGKKDIQDDNSSASDVHGNENVAVVEEHVAKGIDKNEHGKDQHSLEAEFLNVEHVKSEVFFQQKDLLSDGIKQNIEDVTEDVDATNSVQKDSASVVDFSSWSNERTQCRLPSFNKDKEQVPCKYRISQTRQGLSLDAEDFRSIQHLIESRMDGTSSSVSGGSPSQGSLVHRTSNNFNNVVRNERLKKMDELRDQLSRLSGQKGMEKRYQKTDLQYQQQSSSYDVEQHLHSVGVDSIPSSCAQSYYRHERPPRYQPSNHFSPTQTYPHCHFEHVQANIPYNYDMWEFNSYYQSSYAESTVPDHDSLMTSYKEPKQVARKHILRPLSGASPFSICSACFNLIQLPSDIYISKAKIGKMQCGKCAKVLVLSFPAEGKISKEVEQKLNEPATSAIANKDATSNSAECLRGPVSINEEYGASVTRSFSIQAGASHAATQSGKKVSDSALHRLMGYDSASQLLRHSRPLDDVYDSFESMVPVSSRVSRRKNR